ncbi:MAG: NlpC/P60 family protein [Rhodospirillales bacterium]
MSDDDALDPRIHPYRHDVAADFLKGKVVSEAFVPGREQWVAEPHAAVMTAADIGQLQASELLFGETFFVYDEKDGWSWGQCGHDGYVGYVLSESLTRIRTPLTHWVTAARSLVFPDPKGEYPATTSLSLMAKVTVLDEKDEFVHLASGGWLFKRHLAPLGETRPDFIANAETFTRVPYLWGGRGGLGIDCSGLIQVALTAAGIAVPRDSDMQAEEIGEDVPVPDDPAALERGDILFFPGHVGIYVGDGQFLHASSFEMMVATHPLTDVLGRFRERIDAGISRVRRVKVFEGD